MEYGPFKVGATVYTIYGYDCTNVQFFRILDISEKGTATLQLLATRICGDHFNWEETPTDELIGEPFRKRIKSWESYDGKKKYCIKLDSYKSIFFEWDGKPIQCNAR